MYTEYFKSRFCRAMEEFWSGLGEIFWKSADRAYRKDNMGSYRKTSRKHWKCVDRRQKWSGRALRHEAACEVLMDKS